MELNDIFSRTQRRQCKQAILDKQYWFEYTAELPREKTLGEFYFPEEEREGEKKENLEDIQKEILDQLSKCHSTKEERSLLRNTIYEWKDCLDEWEDSELDFKNYETEFLIGKSKELKRKSEKANFNMGEFKKDLIEDYKDIVESYFYEDYGKKFCSIMQKWLRKELKWLRKRSKGYKKRYKDMKFENVLDLHPAAGKIPWKGFEQIGNDKGLTELIYLVKQLYNLGLLNIYKEDRINAIVYNFFQIGNVYYGEDVSKGTVSSTKGKIASQPEDLKEEIEETGKKEGEDISREEVIGAKEQIIVKPEDMKEGEYKDKRVSRIILSRVDPLTHSNFLAACGYKQLTLEEGINRALKNFHTKTEKEL